MASSGMTRKDMAQMFKKIGWKRKEEAAPPPSSQPAVSILEHKLMVTTVLLVRSLDNRDFSRNLFEKGKTLI